MTTTTTSATGLRSLYLVRAVVSVAWVAVAFAAATSSTPDDRPALVMGVLLVVYPLWDAAATVLGQRMTGITERAGTVNIALGVVAAAGTAAATLASTRAALVVFGVWALASGAVQLLVAVRRWRTVGAQWPMAISGGLSVLAGASFALSAGSTTSGLAGIAGYSAFGAFWFVVAAVALSVRLRRTPVSVA